MVKNWTEGSTLVTPLPFFIRSSQKFNVCVISYMLPDKNLIMKQKIHSYGYVYICQVCGAYPKGFETAVHKEIMTGKRIYFSIREIMLIVKLQPQITYTIQHWKNKCCAITEQVGRIGDGHESWANRYQKGTNFLQENKWADQETEEVQRSRSWTDLQMHRGRGQGEIEELLTMKEGKKDAQISSPIPNLNRVPFSS